MDVRSIALLVGLALGLGCQINSGGVGTGGGSAGVGTETGEGGTTLPPVLTDDGGTTTPGGTTEPPPGTGSDGTTGLDGSSSGSGDTGDPMLPRPDPYGVAVPLTELNDALGAADDDPTLRQDQREIYFASTRLGDEDIFVATRASVDVPFDTPMIVGGNISTFSQETTPELSRDGTLLLFASDRRGNGLEIYYTTRASMASLSWALPQPLPALSSMAHESAATPQHDQATLLFCSDRMPTDGGADIWRAAFDPGTVMVSDLQRVAELASPALDCPGNSNADMTWLSFESGRTGTQGGQDLWVAQRTAEGDGYWPPYNLSELNTAAEDGDPWVSADMQTIYFSSNRTGNYDLYMARQVP
ncbi:MAG: PD40 domain-containing protein [Myxococcales bacterium]|nr:PD40 domain-containing protein [Myxococcales bacterium]